MSSCFLGNAFMWAHDVISFALFASRESLNIQWANHVHQGGSKRRFGKFYFGWIFDEFSCKQLTMKPQIPICSGWGMFLGWQIVSIVHRRGLFWWKILSRIDWNTWQVYYEFCLRPLSIPEIFCLLLGVHWYHVMSINGLIWFGSHSLPANK